MNSLLHRRYTGRAYGRIVERIIVPLYEYCFGSRNLHYVQWRLRKLPPPAVSVVNLAGERKFLMVTSYRQ